MKCLTDGELQTCLTDVIAGRRRQETETHLASCAICRAAFDRLAATNAHVDGLLSSLAPEDLPVSTETALAQIRQRVIAPSPRLIGQQWWALVAAACVVAILLGLWQQTRLGN